MKETKALYIYNLFPLFYKGIESWTESIESIINMGFNSIYINPFHETGASGSIYAVKDYYQYNPLFFTNLLKAESELKDFLFECKQKNIDVFMDLVINHTAIDSPLTLQHKNWYVLNEKGKICKPKTLTDQGIITWEDLAKFNIENSPDKDNLQQYLLNMCRHYLKLGFSGFRCDAAYHISSEFWLYLINRIKLEFPNTLFLAETFFCPIHEIRELVNSGFDYIFNSAKWWNFNDNWCLEQYDITSKIVPSISFPETHDTPRLMTEVKGDEKAFLQRLYFTAIFSKGFMIVTGFEHGFTKKINFIIFKNNKWEHTDHDYTNKIKNILRIKEILKPLHEESQISIVKQFNKNILCFKKTWGDDSILIVTNKSLKCLQNLCLNNIEEILNKDKIIDYSPEKRLCGYIDHLNCNLLPGEVKIFASELIYSS